jgi:hypothetical protein
MWNLFKKKKAPEVVTPPAEEPKAFMSTHRNPYNRLQKLVDDQLKRMHEKGFEPFHQIQNIAGTAMDNQINTKAQSQGGQTIPSQQVYWYASQSFIGFQLCAMLSQQWLIKKCCLMPAKDAVRNGFDITVNDGTVVGPEILDEIKRLDVAYRLNYNLIQLIDQGRTFGIRIAMFIVESDDKDYYKKPFNPDGILPGSYKGISQVDPYWITPQLDSEAAGSPGSIHFYEPTWWNIDNKLVHRTHLIIYKTEELPDIIKPTYIYAGVSIPQKIYERVYAAERTANEAPLLALTKRTDVLKTDMAQAIADEPGFVARIQNWVFNRDNYGIKTIGLDDDYDQRDTSLADLDAVIMTQYQLVAAAANIPAVKLLGTAPKGFNSTGEYEEANYHEELESIQTHDLTPLIERHWLLLIRSEICPKFNIEPFIVTPVWRPLDAMTAKELAEVNFFKAQTGSLLSQSGAIDGYDERERIIADSESGYSGLNVEEVPENPEVNENDFEPVKKDRELI